MPNTAKLGIEISVDDKELAKIENVGTRVKKSTDKAGDAFDGLTKDIKETEKATGNYRDETGRLRSSTGKFVKDVEKIGPAAEKSSKKAEGSMKSLGGVAKAVGATILAAFTFDVIKEGVTAFASFEDQLLITKAASGATAKELDMLKAKALELGGEPAQTPAMVAEGMAEMSRAGQDANDIMASVAATAQLAAASELDFGQAAEFTTDILSQFGKQASDTQELVDLLVAGANSASVTVTQLAEAFKYAGSISDSMDISLQSTTAALLVLANAGIKSERGGTSLRAIWNKLLKKSDELADSYGVQVTEMKNGQIVTRDLADIIDQLSASNLNAIERTKLFGTIAGPGIAVLLKKGGDAIREYEASLDAAGGTGDRVSKTMQEGLGGALRTIGSDAQVAGLKIGDFFSPAVKLLASMSFLAGRAVDALSTTFYTLSSSATSTAASVAVLYMGILELKLLAERGLGFETSALEDKITAVNENIKAAQESAVDLAGKASSSYASMLGNVEKNINAEKKHQKEIKKTITTVNELKEAERKLGEERETYKVGGGKSSGGSSSSSGSSGSSSEADDGAVAAKVTAEYYAAIQTAAQGLDDTQGDYNEKLLAAVNTVEEFRNGLIGSSDVAAKAILAANEELLNQKNRVDLVGESVEAVNDALADQRTEVHLVNGVWKNLDETVSNLSASGSIPAVNDSLDEQWKKVNQLNGVWTNVDETASNAAADIIAGLSEIQRSEKDLAKEQKERAKAEKKAAKEQVKALKEIEKATKEAAKAAEKAEKERVEAVEDAFETMGLAGKDYYDVQLGKINEQVSAWEAAGVSRLQIESYLYEQIKELAGEAYKSNELEAVKSLASVASEYEKSYKKVQKASEEAAKKVSDPFKKLKLSPGVDFDTDPAERTLRAFLEDAQKSAEDNPVVVDIDADTSAFDRKAKEANDIAQNGGTTSSRTLTIESGGYDTNTLEGINAQVLSKLRLDAFIEDLGGVLVENSQAKIDLEAKRMQLILDGISATREKNITEMSSGTTIEKQELNFNISTPMTGDGVSQFTSEQIRQATRM